MWYSVGRQAGAGGAAGAGESRRGGGEGEKVDCVSGHRGNGGAELWKSRG